MCGISIIISKSGDIVPKELITQMNDKIIHRGPDSEGYHFGKSFAFGHRRLKIIDLSEAGHQPMQFQNLVITYNGEVYNYLELRAELSEMGYIFNSQTDTEVVLKAFHAWGIDSFSRFNGMWAFSIFDSETDELVFCRDHYGIKPLNYYSSNNYFAAASEIKQICALPDFTPTLNIETGLNFLANGLLNTNEETFFKDVKELRGGHYLVYSLKTNSFQIKKWYNHNHHQTQPKTSYADAAKRVNSLLSHSIKLRCRSDVKLGSCLSGGIDSSAIVCLIHEKKMDGFYPLTITSCYANKKYDEQKFSDLVTQQTGYEAIKVYPDLDLLLNGDLDKIIYHQDQPIASASHYSEFSVFKTAKENNITVMLDGQGADEYFGGYGEFFTIRLYELFRSFRFLAIYRFLRSKAQASGRSLYSVFRSFSYFLVEHKFHGLINRLRRKQVLPQDFFSDHAKKKHKNIIKAVLKRHFNFRNLSIDELLYTSIPYQLHSEDRNSMMFSIESRLPFLDNNLVEFGMGLPSSFKISQTFTKAILRDAVPFLPESIRNRKDKMGFVAPEQEWFLENAPKIRPDIVEATKIFIKILSPDILNSFDNQIIKEKKYNPFFFRLWTFYRWYKIFQVKQ